MTVCYYDVVVEAFFDFWPEEHEFWGVEEVLLGDAVDLLC